MIGWLIAATYVVVAVLASRPVYGRLRAHSIDACLKRWTLYIDHQGNLDLSPWNSSDRPSVMTSSLLLALLWPLLWVYPVALGLRRYMSGTKVRSEAEINAERKAMERRIVELESELDL